MFVCYTIYLISVFVVVAVAAAGFMCMAFYQWCSGLSLLNRWKYLWNDKCLYGFIILHFICEIITLLPNAFGNVVLNNGCCTHTRARASHSQQSNEHNKSANTSPCMHTNTDIANNWDEWLKYHNAAQAPLKQQQNIESPAVCVITAFFPKPFSNGIISQKAKWE